MRDKSVLPSMLVLVAVITILMVATMYFNAISPQQLVASQLSTASVGQGTQPYRFLNITARDASGNALKNVHVVVFSNGNVLGDNYTDSQGKLLLSLHDGLYIIQFEKYGYAINSTAVNIVQDSSLNETMRIQTTAMFGILPSWAIWLVVGAGLFVLMCFEREELHLESWGRPKNWVGKSYSGSWTFIEKSTKLILYGISFVFLIIFALLVLSNIPTFQGMAVYYIILGGLSLLCIVIEGLSSKYWIAALGFGRKAELIGDVLLGVSFAFIFIGATGFASQLDLMSVISPNSLVSILMIGIVASFFEEGFFSGVLAPTFAEKLGMLPSVILTTAVFMFGHGFVYGWALLPLISVLIFRVVATVIVLYKKSWFGVFIAHAIVNILSIVTLAMVALH